MNRKTRLKADPAKVRAWQEKSRKPLKKTKLAKLNVRQEAKRKAKMRKWYASAEYKRQRKESLDLAGQRCEYRSEYQAQYGDGTRLRVETRCGTTEGLHMHELRYKFEKSTPADRIILCKAHHELVELRDHPTRRRYLQGAKG